MADSLNHDLDDLQAREVESCLDGRVKFLTFPKRLAHQYEIETGRVRDHKMIVRSVVGLLLLDLYFVTDYFVVPDVIALAAWLRFGLMTGVGAVIFGILAYGPSAWLRETLQALAMIVAIGILCALVTLSENPLREQYIYSMLLVVMFTLMVVRLRFWYALAANAVCLLMHSLVVWQFKPFVLAESVAASGLMATGIFLSMVACYTLEREERISYLHGLLQRLRNKELEVLSNHDPLTNLGNRRALERRLSDLKAGARRGDYVGLILADIDYFKAYNDAFGHLDGDRCIRRVADSLVYNVSNFEADVFRFGGEEFIVLVTRANLAETIHLAEKLCRSVEDERIPQSQKVPGAWLTSSFGVSALPLEQNLQLDELIAVADAALYEAKSQGRNRVCPLPFGVIDGLQLNAG